MQCSMLPMSNHATTQPLHSSVSQTFCKIPRFYSISRPPLLLFDCRNGNRYQNKRKTIRGLRRRVILQAKAQLDLSEENVVRVLAEARSELSQLFDRSVGITGTAELAELDGPFVKIRLKGRFWHQRSTVLARLRAFLQQRIPEILEVEIEDEAQLDDSPENF